VRAALFDLDGTLVDTERQTGEALARLIARYGYVLAGDERDFVVGHSWVEIHELLSARHPGFAERLPLEMLMAEAVAEREPLVADVTPLPGAAELVKRLHERVPLGLVSGSSRGEIRQVLRGSGLLDYFGVWLGAEDTGRGKPAPDGYLEAARRLAVPPTGCLVLEDSNAGIRAAKAAGMRCVALRQANFAGHDQSAADRVVDTCHEVTDDLIQSLWTSEGGAS
jgi:HAD superfamily hydrolase (TIGR01509 family)